MEISTQKTKKSIFRADNLDNIIDLSVTSGKMGETKTLVIALMEINNKRGDKIEAKIVFDTGNRQALLNIPYKDMGTSYLTTLIKELSKSEMFANWNFENAIRKAKQIEKVG